jgi:hypothetical protein
MTADELAYLLNRGLTAPVVQGAYGNLLQKPITVCAARWRWMLAQSGWNQ